MKKTWKLLTDAASGLGTLISAIIFFPKLDNGQLFQSKITFASLATVLIIVAYLLVRFISKVIKRKDILLVIGLICFVSSLFFLFLVYFPFENKKVRNLKNECGGTFIIGDVVNREKLDKDQGINYDSLSRFDPDTFIHDIAGCNPEYAWTSDSIEHNLNILIFRYCITIFLFSFGFYLLIRSVFQI